MPRAGVIYALVGAVAIAATVWLARREDPTAPQSAAAPHADDLAGGQPTGLSAAEPRVTASPALSPQAEVAPSATAPAEARRASALVAWHSDREAVVWPGAVHKQSTRTASAAGTPSVPVKLAFRALWYLGVDPQAESTWARAINDRNHTEEVRSDLIIDMVDEGYTDNDHPTQADLPLIAARLDILERHAPLAMDEANRKAFAEAYRTLLELYVRLGGQGRRAGGGR